MDIWEGYSQVYLIMIKSFAELIMLELLLFLVYLDVFYFSFG